MGGTSKGRNLAPINGFVPTTKRGNSNTNDCYYVILESHYYLSMAMMQTNRALCSSFNEGPIYEKALKAGLKVLVYEGDIDACGLQTSDVEDVFVPLFDSIMKKTQTWRPWTGDGYQELGGYVIEWDDRKAQFVSVRGSGHLVPLNRLKMSSVMINAFTQGHKLPKLNSNPLQQKEII